MSNFCSLRTLNDDQIAESFMMEQHFLRLRSLTTRAVVAAVQLTSTEDESSSHSENKQKLVTVIGELADSMEHWVKNSQNEFGQLPPSHFVNPIQVGARLDRSMRATCSIDVHFVPGT